MSQKKNNYSKENLTEEIRELVNILENACRMQNMTIRDVLRILEEEQEEGTTSVERYVRSMTTLTDKEKVIIETVLTIMKEAVSCPSSKEIVEELNLRLHMSKSTYGKLEIHQISEKFLKEYFEKEGLKIIIDTKSRFAVRFKLSEISKVL